MRLDVTATRAQRTGSAFGRKSGKQALNATLATAAAAAGAGLARDLADGLGITHVDGLKNSGRLDLIAVTDQRVRRLRPHLLGHVQNDCHRV